MANILTKDFEADTTDAEPSGITKWDGAVANTYAVKTARPFENSKGLLMTGAGSFHAGYYYTTPVTTGDFTYEGVFNADISTADRFGLAFRCWDDSGTAKGYFACLRNGNSLRLARFSNTTETTLTTLAISAISIDIWYHLKVNTNNSAIKVKYWADGDAEPETWHIDTTDATYDNSKRGLGVYLFAGNASNLYYADYLIADDGITASTIRLLGLLGVGV